MKVVKVTRRIPAETYGYFEVELEGIESLQAVHEMAEMAAKHESDTRSKCEHFFTKKVSGTKKDGGKWVKEVCTDSRCGAQRWENSGKWGPWDYPVRK